MYGRFLQMKSFLGKTCAARLNPVALTRLNPVALRRIPSINVAEKHVD